LLFTFFPPDQPTNHPTNRHPEHPLPQNQNKHRLKQQPGVDPQRTAVAGFCYGGASALRYAASRPAGAVRAVGVFYGRPLEQREGYSSLSGVPVYGVYGDRDSQFSQEVVDGLEVRLGGGGGAFGGGWRGVCQARAGYIKSARANPYPIHHHSAPPKIKQAGLLAAGAEPLIRRFAGQGHAFVTDVDATRQPGSAAADAWSGFVEFLRDKL